MMRTLHPVHKGSLNLRAAYLHILGDLLGSIGVILSGALLWLTGWNLIDPIISLLFSLGILYGSGKIIRESLFILMESTPEGIDPHQIEQDLLTLPGIREVHDLHVWTVGPKKQLSAHISSQKRPKLPYKKPIPSSKKSMGSPI